MASLFWVGGSAAYDGVTNCLATTSGGVATVAAITSADSVTFDSNSPAAAVVTTSAAITCTTITLNSTFTGSLTMSNPLNASVAISHSQGTLDISGQTCTTGTYSSSGTNTRTLTMVGSTLTCTGGGTAFNVTINTGFTLNATSSTIILSGAASVLNCGNGGGFAVKTFGDVSFTGSGAANLSGTVNTIYNNVTRTGTAVKTDSFLIQNNQTINGVLTVTGNSISNRMLLQSASTGTARTLALGTTGTASLTNVDVVDITVTGTAAPVSGTSVGDIGGNTGITTSTPTTRYWIGGSGLWSDPNKWSTSSGGAAGTSVPLPQDDVVFDNNSGATVAFTVDMPRLGRNIDFSARTNSTTLTISVSNIIYGSINLSGPAWTANWTSPITFAGRGTCTINSGTRAFSGATNTVAAVTGTYTLASDITFNASSSNAITLASGTLTANAFNVSVTGTGSGTRFSQTGGTLNMGSGTWSIPAVNGGTFWSQSGGTLNAGTSTIVTNGASTTTKTFVGGSKVYNDLTYTVAGSAATLTIQGTNTFHDVNFSDATTSRALTLTGNWTLTGNLNMTGTALAPLTLNSGTAGTARTITKTSGTVSLDYVSIQDSTATGGATFYAGANSTNVSNNTGWIFTAPPSGGADSTPALMLMGIGQ